jgi:hypothetical protein
MNTNDPPRVAAVTLEPTRAQERHRLRDVAHQRYTFDALTADQALRVVVLTGRTS